MIDKQVQRLAELYKYEYPDTATRSLARNGTYALRSVNMILRQASTTRDERLALASKVFGRPIATTKELTFGEVRALRAVVGDDPSEFIAWANHIRGDL